MPAHALSEPLQRLERHILERRGRTWLLDAVDPLLEVLEHPLLLDHSELIQLGWLVVLVRAAAAPHLPPCSEEWPIATLGVSAVGLVHGSASVGRLVVTFLWLDSLRSGLVLITDPITRELDIVSICLDVVPLSGVAEA